MFCFISLFRADVIDYGNAFNLTMYLTNETDYIVWSRVASSIAYVRDMLSGNAALYPMFQVRGLLILPHAKLSDFQICQVCLSNKDLSKNTQIFLHSM